MVGRATLIVMQSLRQQDRSNPRLTILWEENALPERLIVTWGNVVGDKELALSYRRA